MTGGSGAALPPPRPTTPTDPTLISRSAPRKRAFPIRSFGPGASIDTESSDWDATRASWEEFDRTAKAKPGGGIRSTSDVRHLIDTIRFYEEVLSREDGAFMPEPTWGFYVFLTDYDQVTRDNIPRAMKNWVKAIQRSLRPRHAGSSKVHSDEAFRRLRLDLVDDVEAFNHASIDRVRQGFRALVRSFESADDGSEWARPPRNRTCLVLNAQKVQMLVDLTFSEDEDDFKQICAFLDCHVTAVDIEWQRPEVTRDNWRGMKNFDIICLKRRYQMLGRGSFPLEELSD